MEWWQIAGIIFGLLFIDSMFGGLIYAYLDDSWNEFVPMPASFKCHTEMNWFGCTVCYIVLFILFPVWNVCKVIYWLFHI